MVTVASSPVTVQQLHFTSPFVEIQKVIQRHVENKNNIWAKKRTS
jgi:hypothetical protein